MNMINSLSDEIFEYIKKIRRELHEIPETAFEENKTHDLICRVLDGWKIPYTTHAKTGVAVMIHGSAPGKTILLRADIDALAIKEETSLPYCSKHDGFMHACGHDAHTAILLGCVYILNSIKDKLHGNVKCIFQPGEEGAGGAVPMINEGIMENPTVDAALALHVSGELECGKISTRVGAVMAAPDEFDIVIKGKSGHAAHPDLAADPIVAASDFIMSAQTLISRRISSAEQAVLTFTSFNSGTNYNIIPDAATLRGTLRSVNSDIRKRLPVLLEEILKGITATHGCDYSFNFRLMYPPTINSSQMVELVCNSAEKIIGKTNIVTETESSMAGDDFAYFAERVPSAYFRLGIANPDIDAVYSIHSSKFKIDENALKLGYKIMSQATIDYLK